MELMLVTGTGVSGGMWWGGNGKRWKDWLGKGGRFVMGRMQGWDEWFLMMGVWWICGLRARIYWLAAFVPFTACLLQLTG